MSKSVLKCKHGLCISKWRWWPQHFSMSLRLLDTPCMIQYAQEHLFIVCELLRANLYEFQKLNKELGGEVYFTLPRLQICFL